MNLLDGRVAVVIGASRGIGKGIALELGEAGAFVYVVGRTVDPVPGRAGSVSETVAEICEQGGEAVGIGCDATNDDALAEVFERIGRERSELHILVNSVFDASTFGESMGKRFWEIPLSVWHDVVDVTTRSAYVAAVKAAPLLLAAGNATGALMVNISSFGARRYFYNTIYGMGKAALDKMTADMAVELKNEGVATVSLWPNVTRTEAVDAQVAAGNVEQFDAFGGPDALETPRYNGRAVVALAADPAVMERTGKSFWAAEIGEAYGFTDENGRTHDYPRRRAE